MITFKFKPYQGLLLAFLLSSCASYHNLNEDGVNHLGGGYADKQLAKGFFSLTVKTNFAPWKNFSAAWKTWHKRANELCQQQSFENIDVQESSYNTVAGEGYIISQVQGYVLCAEARLEKTEIEHLIATHSYY